MKYIVLNQVLSYAEQKALQAVCKEFDIKLNRLYVRTGHYGSKCYIFTEAQWDELLRKRERIPYKFENALHDAWGKMYRQFSITSLNLGETDGDRGSN